MFIWAGLTIISSNQALLLRTGATTAAALFILTMGKVHRPRRELHGRVYRTTAASSVGVEVRCRCGQDGWFMFPHLLLSYSCSPVLSGRSVNEFLCLA